MREHPHLLDRLVQSEPAAPPPAEPWSWGDGSAAPLAAPPRAAPSWPPAG